MEFGALGVVELGVFKHELHLAIIVLWQRLFLLAAFALQTILNSVQIHGCGDDFCIIVKMKGFVIHGATERAAAAIFLQFCKHSLSNFVLFLCPFALPKDLVFLRKLELGRAIYSGIDDSASTALVLVAFQWQLHLSSFQQLTILSQPFESFLVEQHNKFDIEAALLGDALRRVRVVVDARVNPTPGHALDLCRVAHDHALGVRA
mmetsp:Transcript_52204/g.76440  ORF Transcript_52204/g.76440 Transcript_52204/m.76440 type:complete len:205 (-) Transcript_52204:1211-1825(-)